MACRLLWLCALLALAGLGCGKSSLTADAGIDRAVDRPRPDDGGRDTRGDGGTDSRGDGGTDSQGDGGRDASLDAVPLTGRRSFDVIVEVTPVPPASSGGTSYPIPTTVAATLVVDATERWLLLGDAGAGDKVGIDPDGAAMVIKQAIGLTVPFGAACNAASTLEFSTLKVTLGADGRLHGTGAGSSQYIVGDVGYTQAFTATVDGAPDTTPPALSSGTAVTLDPLALGRFPASEPLPDGVKAQLVATDGSVVELTPQKPQDTYPVFVTAFLVPSVLPYDTSYRLVVDQVADFAGHPPVQPPPVVTVAAPPLLSDGGFEATPAGTVGSGTIFSGGGLPVISGTKSLYLDGTPGASRTVVFRLAVHPGDTAVRFAYRVASTYSSGGFFGSILVGSPGAKLGSLSFLALGTPTITVAGTSGGTLTIGPVATAELPLPDPAASEVVLKIATAGTGCGLPPPAGGLIIDDVRVGP